MTKRSSDTDISDPDIGMATPHGESGTGSRQQPTVKISIEHYVPETRYNLQLTREGGFVGGEEKYFALHIDFVSAQKGSEGKRVYSVCYPL